MDFDFKEFIEVVFPVILKQSTKGYYVKGGRAHDFYFRDKTNSLDWDLIVTKKFAACTGYALDQYAKKNGLILVNHIVPKETSFFGYEMHQYGFKGHDSGNNDPFFVDMIIHDSISPSEFIRVDSVNYVTLMDFVSDLILTQRNRYQIVSKTLKPSHSAGEYDLELDDANNMHYEKYLKTRKRFDNVIDISWENLSIEYRRYLMSECKKTANEKIQMFRISDTCSGYLNCSDRTINSNVDKCITDESKTKFTSTEQFIKGRLGKKKINRKPVTPSKRYPVKY